MSGNWVYLTVSLIPTEHGCSCPVFRCHFLSRWLSSRPQLHEQCWVLLSHNFSWIWDWQPPAPVWVLILLSLTTGCSGPLKWAWLTQVLQTGPLTQSWCPLPSTPGSGPTSSCPLQPSLPSSCSNSQCTRSCRTDHRACLWNAPCSSKEMFSLHIHATEGSTCRREYFQLDSVDSGRHRTAFLMQCLIEPYPRNTGRQDRGGLLKRAAFLQDLEEAFLFHKEEARGSCRTYLKIFSKSFLTGDTWAMTRIFQSWKRAGRRGRVRALLNTQWRAHLGAGPLSTQTCLVWLDCLPWLPTFKTWGPPIKIWISGFSSKAGHAGSAIPAGKSGRREQGCFQERTETSGLLPVVAHLRSLPGPVSL